ncbi:hypothetical protein GUITHDRAFT_64569 [Guillardia theta CCMP2712]|uniref:NAD(P)-binding domain-containing protein n=1 Tax=Guillardia theta (strain CCMP2712) TaxID=905079 RepID=L1JYJ7_GUITC|nr:hypothetical protein GUITHDRAFT_64569 [Guillardia theta CCMP2712]EKX53168.1 hypothetical protein GUITHDRAFT_64569 [Guillardia theta CCMP2712]|eukprot:XP_005840148.1 hypothetical protein GUITHDRAFT_64569 [Guillardia theta CCMP2712]
MSHQRDLLVVGAGTLGSLLIQQHKEKFPEARVVAETRTDAKHEALKSLGAEARTVSQAGDEKFANVVFCAAPGGNDNYAAEVDRALNMWSGAGKFVFTSSGGVYAESSGGTVNEQSPVASSARTQKLIDAEKCTTERGGSVLRLAGLYTLERGAHNYWLNAGKVDGRPDGLIGLVSYEDAAAAALTVLSSEKSVKGEVFVICDGKEQTRQDICESALKTAMYRDKKLPVFTTTEGPIGKRYDISKALELGWKPRYPSFDEFCDLHK